MEKLLKKEWLEELAARKEQVIAYRRHLHQHALVQPHEAEPDPVRFGHGLRHGFRCGHGVPPAFDGLDLNHLARAGEPSMG